MYKIISFLTGLFSKTAEQLANKKVKILKTFTTAVEDLQALNGKIDAQVDKHNTKIADAQTTINESLAEQKALVTVKAQNESIAKKIEALLS